ncbi:MAG TPA: hypothetical protein ENH82_12040, partial [bacterium]|nr:hypothetical protein [bacterium]
MKKQHVVDVCVFIVAVMMIAFTGSLDADELYYSAIFSESDLSFKWETVDSITYAIVKVKGCHTTPAVLEPENLGKPALPTKVINLIIPAGHVVESINILFTESKILKIPYKVYPNQPAEPLVFEIKDFVEPDSLVYSIDDPYPSSFVDVGRYGDFFRVNRIVTLVVYPVQYYPQPKQLRFYSEIRFSVNTISGKPSGERTGRIYPVSHEAYWNALYSIVDNPKYLKVYAYSPPVIYDLGLKPSNKMSGTQDGPPTDYEYVVITQDSLMGYFNDFIIWLKRKGLKAGCVSVSDIINYSGYSNGDGMGLSDDAGKIRGYLIDSYGTTKWVLLGGDFENVPVRKAWVHYKETNDMYYNPPTDMYYSDLDGDWDFDNDDRYGEPPYPFVESSTSDSPCIDPDIWVGRLPCVNGKDIQYWTEKLLKYEQNPGNGNYSYLKKIYTIAADEMTTYVDDHSDNIDEYISNAGLSYKKIKEDQVLTGGSDIITEMNNHYGLINWFCHGMPNRFAVKTYGINLSPKQYVFTYDDIGDDTGESGNGLDNMTNENYYSVVYSSCCLIAAHDDYLECPGRSIVEGFTCFEKKGGPALLGNTRAVGLQFIDELMKEFYKVIFNDGVTRAGVAEANSKVALYTHSWNWSRFPVCMIHQLFGDPQMRIWTDEPSTFNNVSITVDPSSVTVNSGVSGCIISVSSADFSYHKVQDNVQSMLCTTPLRPLYIVITKKNFIPYQYITVLVLTGDFNSDGCVNISDFALFGDHYLTTPSASNWDPLYDLNNDGYVNISDFGIFGECYLRCLPGAGKLVEMMNPRVNVSAAMTLADNSSDATGSGSDYVVEVAIQNVTELKGFDFILQYEQEKVEFLRADGLGESLYIVRSEKPGELLVAKIFMEGEVFDGTIHLIFNSTGKATNSVMKLIAGNLVDESFKVNKIDKANLGVLR